MQFQMPHRFQSFCKKVTNYWCFQWCPQPENIRECWIPTKPLLIWISLRITVSLELERTLKGHWVHQPCNEQGHPQLKQVAQSLVQPGLECLHGWGIHHIPDNLYQCLTTLTAKDFFLMSNLNLPSLNYYSFLFSSVIMMMKRGAVQVSVTIYLGNEVFLSHWLLCSW